MEQTQISSEENRGVVQNSTTIFKSLWKRKIQIILIATISAVLGIFYASQQAPIFKSKLRFALDESSGKGGVTGVLNLAAQFGISVGGGSDMFEGDNILEILTSRRMIERVFLSVDTLNNKPTTLIEFYLQNSPNISSILKRVHFLVGVNKSELNYSQDSVLFVIYKKFADNYISAEKPDRKVSIYEVNVISGDEKFTKIFTDRLVNETNTYYTEIRSKKGRETLEVLETRVASMKGNLNTSITNKASTQDINLNPAFSAAQVPVQKQQVNIQVYSAAYAEMFKNLELARFQYLNALPLMQIIDGADYPMEKIKVGWLRSAFLFSVISVLVYLLSVWFRRVIRNL